jgi:hypothetical protein
MCEGRALTLAIKKQHMQLDAYIDEEIPGFVLLMRGEDGKTVVEEYVSLETYWLERLYFMKHPYADRRWLLSAHVGAYPCVL